MTGAGPPPAPSDPAQLSESLQHNIRTLERRRTAAAASASREDRIASAITAFTGSMTFVYLHLIAYGGWVVVNLGVVPGVTPFDPSFVILASEASVEAIFLSTFVLISQNRMQAAADKRADLDLHINLLTEHELTRLAPVINAIAAKLGVEVADDMADVERVVAPETVLDTIEEEQRIAGDRR